MQEGLVSDKDHRHPRYVIEISAAPLAGVWRGDLYPISSQQVHLPATQSAVHARGPALSTKRLSTTRAISSCRWRRSILPADRDCRSVSIFSPPVLSGGWIGCVHYRPSGSPQGSPLSVFQAENEGNLPFCQALAGFRPSAIGRTGISWGLHATPKAISCR